MASRSINEIGARRYEPLMSTVFPTAVPRVRRTAPDLETALEVSMEYSRRHPQELLTDRLDERVDAQREVFNNLYQSIPISTISAASIQNGVGTLDQGSSHTHLGSNIQMIGTPTIFNPNTIRYMPPEMHQVGPSTMHWEASPTLGRLNISDATDAVNYLRSTYGKGTFQVILADLIDSLVAENTSLLSDIENITRERDFYAQKSGEV